MEACAKRLTKIAMKEKYKNIKKTFSPMFRKIKELEKTASKKNIRDLKKTKASLKYLTSNKAKAADEKEIYKYYLKKCAAK